jgi:hypothetical protein
MGEESSLEEIREILKDPEFKETFYRGIKKDLNIREMGIIKVMRCMIDNIVVSGRLNDWCVPKTLYTRANVRTSLNQFYYHTIPRLISMGFLEMKMYVSPSGENKRVVRMSETFVCENLGPIMKKMKEGQE